MKFLHPQFLWALFALAIPLVIHLFNFRRYKTIYFSDTRFLQEVVKSSKNINRLRHWLIMLARMAALAMLVLAFAYPYIPGAQTEEEVSGHASIYLDNSASMMSGPQQQSPLAEARSKAAAIIKSLPQRYRIQVLTNDFSGRQQRFYSKNEALQLVDETQVSYAFRSVGEVIQRMQNAHVEAGEPASDIFLISDFQRSTFDSLPDLTSNWRTSLLPVQMLREQQNLSIDSAWFDRPVLQPGFNQELNFSLHNSGKPYSGIHTIELQVDGETQGVEEIEFKAEGRNQGAFNLLSELRGNFAGQLSLDASAPYFDNRFYFSFTIDQPIQVLLSGSDMHREAFQRLFSDSIFQIEYQPIGQIDYSGLADFDLIILDEPETLPSGLIQQLQAQLENGSNLILIPQTESLEASNDLLLNLGSSALGEMQQGGRIDRVHDEDPLFKEVFARQPKRSNLPEVKSFLSWRDAAAYPLLSLANQRAVVSRLPVGSGNLILFQNDLASLRVLEHPILVPIALNAALYSRQSRPLYTYSGQKQGLRFPAPQGKDQAIHLELKNGESMIPPQRRMNTSIEIFNLPAALAPGIYPVKNEDQSLGLLALNVDPRESQWSFWSPEELSASWGLTEAAVIEAETAQLGPDIQRRFEGQPLWKYFILATLLFLLIEIILIKLWK